MNAVDFAWARPTPAALKAAGVAVVMRYLSHDTSGKTLTRAEADSYLAVGMTVGLNFEDANTNALAGAVQGMADAKFANELADQLGAPADVEIFYSCDTLAIFGQVASYYRAAKSVGGRPVSFYGGMAVGLALQAEGTVVSVWAADAASWSGFASWDAMAAAARASSQVAMLQHVDHPLVGVDPSAYDFDEILRPFTAWGDTPPEADPMILIPRRAVAHPAFAGRVGFLTFDPASKTVTSFNGIDLEEPEGFTVTRGFGCVVARLTEPTEGQLNFAENADGTAVVITAAGDGGTFTLPYTQVAPAAGTTIDVAEIAAVAAAHLKLTVT